MNCVNKSSKEFKDLILRHNVDSNVLELIVHKYWKETEQEDSFPSDVYIQAQLGFSQYKEPSKIIRTLWKTQYSHPKEFLTFQQLQTALEQAHKVFPSEAIVYYKNSKGNYVLNIKEPVSSFKEFPLQRKAMSDKEASFHLSYWEWRRIKKKALEDRIGKIKNLKQIYDTIKQFNIENGTNFQFYYGEVQGRLSKYLIDRISSTGSASDRSQLQVISSFLQQLFPGIQVKVMDKENFGSVISQYGFPVNTQAFLMGNTIYTSTEMKSADVLIEEFLHPFIEVLYNSNRELFDNLWKEAQREFSMLAYQIRESYSPVAYQNLSEEVRAKELVTQALSRYMRESMGKDGTRHNKFKDFVKQFIAFIKDMFGLNQTPEFRKSATGTRMIPISSLTNINSLANLASALNTEGISFD